MRFYAPSGAAAPYPYYFTVTLLDGRDRLRDGERDHGHGEGSP
jgi:hypothetical protein